MRKLTQGNEAVFRGAVAAGASYFAGYPISPSTEILNVASGWAAEHPDFRFLQAEDEIASANAIIEEQNCILCGLCERYCPDIAIEMLPEAVAAHASQDKSA